jgi:hypothetical protein
MVDVLLSYAHEDRPVSAAIAAELTKLGVDVWWDHELLGGDDFRQRISEMLARAPATIVIWSGRSVQSKWVINEASTAEEHGNLIPISIDGAPPPIDFRSLHTIDLKEWIPGDPLPAPLLRTLGKSLKRDLGREAPEMPEGGIFRLQKRVAMAWYGEFETVVLYLIGQGLACFLVGATIPPLANQLTPSSHWVAYLLAVIEAMIIAALYLRPVLEVRRIGAAIRVFTSAVLLGLLAYCVVDTVIATLELNEIMMVFGSVTFAFILITTMAERATNRP